MENIMRLRHFILAAAALLAATQAFAHESQGPNGGRIVDAGTFHVELVVKDTRVDVFLSDDDDKPVAPKGFKGTAILMAGGKAQRVPLGEADGTSLTGTSAVPLPADANGVVQLTTPDGKTAQGQFK
jgi:hypothetical protein